MYKVLLYKKHFDVNKWLLNNYDSNNNVSLLLPQYQGLASKGIVQPIFSSEVTEWGDISFTNEDDAILFALTHT